MIKVRGAALAALLVVGVAGGAARAEERYWVTDVGLPGGDYVTARRLNASGQVAGTVSWVDPAGFSRSQVFLYTQGTAVPIGEGGYVEDINDRGQVLAYDAAGSPYLFDGGTYWNIGADGLQWAHDLGPAGHVVGRIWPPDGGNGHAGIWFNGTVQSLQEALLPLGAIGSEAYFVNSKGEVVGIFWDASFTSRVFLYSGGVATALDPFYWPVWTEDGRFGAINESSMVAGTSFDANWVPSVGYNWEGLYIPLPEALPSGARVADARGLNDQNDLFGRAYTSDVQLLTHGFVFRYEDQTLIDVGSLGGETCLHGINNRGDVVGHSRLPGDGAYRGHAPGPNVIVTGGRMYDLNELISPDAGWTLAAYEGVINDAGQILLPGYDPLGRERPVLLTPFPTTKVQLAGTRRADGWFTSNVTALISASAVPGVREVRYRLDDRDWVTVTGTAAEVKVTRGGTHALTVQSVDSLGHAETARTETFSIDKGGLVITTPSLPFATSTAPYSVALAAQGGVAPYAFAVLTGALPAGLTLDRSGTIAGTAAADGQASFQVEVTDATGATARSALALEVLAPLRVTTPEVVDGTGGAGIALTASGGRAPYSWALDPSTPLPAGFALDFATIFTRNVTANPEPGPYGVIVTDAAGQMARAEITFGIVPVTIYLSWGRTVAPAGGAVSLYFAATGGMTAVAGATFAVDGVLPVGLTFEPWGVLSGAVAEPGVYAFNVVAWDGAGNLSEPFPVTLTIQ